PQRRLGRTFPIACFHGQGPSFILVSIALSSAFFPAPPVVRTILPKSFHTIAEESYAMQPSYRFVADSEVGAESVKLPTPTPADDELLDAYSRAVMGAVAKVS